MAHKLMYCTSPMIIKKYSSVDYNKWLKRLDSQVNEPTNQSLIKFLSKDKKALLLDLDTIVINSPISSPSLYYNTMIVTLINLTKVF